MAIMNFGGVDEEVVTREEIPLAKAKEVIGERTIAVLGYGVQGPAQALNLKDNGFKVIIGQRKGTSSWDKAINDGWKEGVDLFDMRTAVQKAEIILNLLSDAGQIAGWKEIKDLMVKGKTLCFSHGFAVTFSDRTGVIPPKDIDVVLVAPKGSGTSVRRLFKQGKGINSSFAIFQDASGKAFETVTALGIGVGSGYLFRTDFKKEVYSDLTGERGVLMGAIAGMCEAQYNVLRANGHSPSEAFNETVEELTQSLLPLVGENGMDWMYANCSTTAQRGALDWKNRFRDAAMPVMQALYQSVVTGNEAQISIDANSRADYKERLAAELAELHNHEMWRTGETVRKLRPGK